MQKNPLAELVTGEERPSVEITYRGVTHRLRGVAFGDDYFAVLYPDPAVAHKQCAHFATLNGRMRDELLNETLFTSLAQVRAVLNAWKDDYNHARPHSALGNLTPTEFAACSAPGPQRGGALRYTMGSASRPVAPPSPMGSNVTGTLLIVG